MTRHVETIVGRSVASDVANSTPLCPDDECFDALGLCATGGCPGNKRDPCEESIEKLVRWLREVAP